MKKTSKLLQTYFWPIWLLIIIILLGVLSIIKYYEITKDINNAYLSGLNGLLVILSTTGGIFIPLWINRNWQKLNEKDLKDRELKFALNNIASELNKNLFVLENARVNFTFKRMLDQIDEFDILVKMCRSKLQTVEKIVSKLSDNQFISVLNSNTLVKIDDYELYNSIFQTYESVFNLKLSITIGCEDFKLKKDLIDSQKELLSDDLIYQFRQSFKQSLVKIWREINYSKKNINLTYKIIEKYLISLEIKLGKDHRILDNIIDLPDDFDIVPDDNILKP